MLKSMIKKLIGKIATPERLAAYAASGIRKAVNESAEARRATMAKYATIGNEATSLGSNITAMLTDGRIDNMEEQQIVKMLVPLFAKVMEVTK